ncbi:MAG TPA: prenyltransferase/squalene oxidase repeat-containing protein [Pirellulaceae bacterium]|nr:prenyltransferase/squalene oxidase repeat-containing protein [Pirellulaceae bacterium]
MIDPDRLMAAYATARADLLDERVPAGHWIGELSTSALSTATAVSALAIVLREASTAGSDSTQVITLAGSPERLSGLIAGGVQYLVTHQNADGGWGDTDKSYSNIATTMLAVAAMHLAGVAGQQVAALDRAEKYIAQRGGIPGLRKRYGVDKTFAVPILTNYAMAGLVDWDEVSPLPFELACVPQAFYRFVRMPVVSYAIPALVAIGQARHFSRPSWNPLLRGVRSLAVPSSLNVLRRMQPVSGGYLEAVPLTSFVVMSLAATGRVMHEVCRNGVRFLIDSVRADGSWPIDTNLATWNTTLAINALAASGEDVAELDCLKWLLSCQQQERHPFTGAEPGGFGWTDLSGSVPDADDTPGALLALAAWRDSTSCTRHDLPYIEEAAHNASRWLLNMQNRDGGWPTFCRGWGNLPFDRSGADLTAHALRALRQWRMYLSAPRVDRAVQRGFRYLERQQRKAGDWVPLWFGNQDHPQEENPIYGTAKVLLAYRDYQKLTSPAAKRAADWLVQQQRADGSWGSAASRETAPPTGSFEETALAVEALLTVNAEESASHAVSRGLEWLMRGIEADQHRNCSPIGFYFAKLWYYESLYPLSFTVSALGQAALRYVPRTQRKTETSPLRLRHA